MSRLIGWFLLCGLVAAFFGILVFAPIGSAAGATLCAVCAYLSVLPLPLIDS